MSASAFVLGQMVKIVSHPHPAVGGQVGNIAALGPDYVRVELRGGFASAVCKPAMLIGVADALSHLWSQHDAKAQAAVPSEDNAFATTVQAAHAVARHRAEWGPARLVRVGGEGTTAREEGSTAQVENGGGKREFFRFVASPFTPLFFTKRAVAPRMSLNFETSPISGEPSHTERTATRKRNGVSAECRQRILENIQYLRESGRMEAANSVEVALRKLCGSADVSVLMQARCDGY